MSEAGDGFRVITRYLEIIAGYQEEPNIYRGQSNTAWEPQPTAFRAGMFGINSRVDLDRWKVVAARFEKAQSDLEWLVLAQHYGVATRLLDWTVNPLIALFFASQHFAPQGTLDFTDGAVFMIPRSAAVRESNPNFDVFTDWHGPPMLIPSETMNRRSVAQASVMTLHCDSNYAMTPGHNARIFTVQVPEKRAVLAALRCLGISPETVYDDINTAAREFSDQRFQEGMAEAFPPQPSPQ